jgi:nitroreductase
MPSSQLGLDRDTAHQLLQAAILAPSSHNTQPWIFRLHEASIELWADRTRALPVNDPVDRELTISCSCALFNLRVAAAHAGIALRINLLPQKSYKDLLASVEMASSGAVATDIAMLWDALTQRSTYRKTFFDRPVSQAHIVALTKAATMEQSWLYCVEGDSTSQAIGILIAEGDAVQWANPSWRRELAMWMHPRRHNDGLTVPGLALPLAQAVVRTFDIGYGVGAKDRQLADASPLLAVLGTDGDAPEHWLLAGQALQRLLLVASKLGLQASYLNQAIQVPTLRPKLQHLIGRSGFPQIVLRLGYPTDSVAASPRRPLEEVIDVANL